MQDDQGVNRLVGMRDYWDIPALRGKQPESVGYPTQKPLGLYERMIFASLNEGDVILDPFAGYATTLVAAENLKWQWVGMDIWDGTHERVTERLQKATGLFLEVKFTKSLPKH